MRNPSRFFVGCSLLVLLVCYGCSYQIPEAELKAAQQAMDQAKSLHAEDLAPSNWKEAMLTWEQAQAAIKEQKPAKTLLLRAKSRFDKAVTIAKANGEGVKREVSEMQTTISERYAKVKAVLDNGRLISKVKNQVATLAREVGEGTSSIDKLVSDGDLIKARALAKEIQRKVYNAELILAGKKPAS
jgi:hypothetical protein